MNKGWKWFWHITVALLVLALLLGIYGLIQARSLGFLRTPVYETVRPQLPTLPRPAVLVFYKTNSFIHKQAIPSANQLLDDLAKEHGWSVYISENGAVHNPQDLAQFDVLAWNNVTGDVLDAAQRAAMRAWLEQGGGFIGLHAAGDGSHDAWPWYQDAVIRARFTGHPIEPQLQQATIKTVPRADPIIAGLPAAWVRKDEWYSFESSLRSATTSILATIDESSYVPGSFFGTQLAMGDDHPIIWKHCVKQGRARYFAMGHTAHSYAEPEYRELLQRAIAWAGRLQDGNTSSAWPQALDCEAPRASSE